MQVKEIEEKVDRFFRGLLQILIVLIQLVLIGLKLSGSIDVPWFWVLTPLWAVVGSFVFMLAVVGVIIMVVSITENKR